MSVVVAKRYANSIFNLAKEKEVLGKTYNEVNVLKALFKESDKARELLINPVISFSKKKEIFNKIFGDLLSSFTATFFYFIIKNKRANKLIQILEEYNRLYRSEKKIMYLDLITAKKANEELKNIIIKRLGEDKKVLVNEKINPKILGGVLIRVDDRQFDSTVKSYINKIKSSFKI